MKMPGLLPALFAKTGQNRLAHPALEDIAAVVLKASQKT